jgi:response regulator of citrate/malate metabolism
LKEIGVLIVEDDPMVIEINTQFLRDAPGYSLLGAARTAADAVSMVERLRPNLILLDVYLPDASGVELLHRIRQAQLDLDVIMVTAAKEVPVVQDTLRLGIRDYLVKPYYRERFLKALADYREYFESLLGIQACEQRTIDQILKSGANTLPDSHPLHPSSAIPPDMARRLPKGLTPHTLGTILRLVQASADRGVLIEDVAESTGISPATIRRYLNFMLDEGMARFVPVYGGPGRPTYRYYPHRWR